MAWPRRVLARLRRKKTLLYRSKDEFGLFELSNTGWKEVARLQDSARPGAQRLFRYLLQYHASEEEKQPLRLSSDYVERLHFEVETSDPEKVEELAASTLTDCSPWPDEICWSGFAVLGELPGQNRYRCIAAFVRKADLDELEIHLGGYGWSLDRVEFADIEADRLIRLEGSKKAEEPNQNSGSGRLIKLAAVAVIAVELAGAANLAWLLNEHSDLSSRLDAARKQAWAAHAGSGTGVLPPAELEDVAASRLKVSDLLDHVGGLLPGDAVLTSVVVENDDVQFSGSVRKSGKLLERVRESNLLADAEHEVPSVRLEKQGIDLFTIRAVIRPKGQSNARD